MFYWHERGGWENNTGYHGSTDRLSEKRVSEPWLSRISLPAGGEESVGQMTIVSCGVRTVSDVQIQHCYSTVWREVERFRKILGKVTFEKGTDIVNRC